MRLRKSAAALLALAVAACGRGDDDRNAAQPVISNAAAPPSSNQPGVTPMGQRVAKLGILNKRNGIVQDVSLHPGQSVRWKGVVVRLRACEMTAPWEEEKLTGAFVQVDVQRPDKAWARVFSGWLFKESPSLNVVEHPVYDISVKSCEMTYPAGPPAPAAPVTSSNLSSARKLGTAPAAPSGESTATPPPAEPAPSAADNNAT